MLKKLYDIILLFKEYLLFALFVSISLTLLTFNESAQIRSLRAAAIVTVGFLQDSFAFVPDFLNLQRENTSLREMNMTLSDEVNRLREASLENIRLRDMIGMKEKARAKLVAANVVGKSLQLLRNTITLDVGERDGVRVNVPIVSPHGLVGKIVATSYGYSVGQVLLNKEIRVSAKDQRSRVDGIIRWDGGSSLQLGNVVKTMDVKPGDAIVTSGYSSIYPPGIELGIVSATQFPPGSLFQTIDVTPGVDFTRLEEVFVLAFPVDTSRTILEEKALQEN
ncbi:MAG: rod shape-determining protein MreC [Bacteroidota bacterium]